MARIGQLLRCKITENMTMLNTRIQLTSRACTKSTNRLKRTVEVAEALISCKVEWAIMIQLSVLVLLLLPLLPILLLLLSISV